MRDEQIKDELEDLKQMMSILDNTWAVGKINKILKLLDNND